MPAHGFEKLDELSPPETARVPAVDVITRVAALLMNTAADNLGMAAEGEPHLDLGQARQLITALAGLLAASQESLGEQAAPLRDGLTALQAAFREASSVPDKPGQGPGEKLIS